MNKLKQIWSNLRSSFLQTANIGKDVGVIDANDKDAFIAAAKTRRWDREKFVEH